MQMILQGFGQKKCQEPTAGASASHAKTLALQENNEVSQDSVLACFLQLRTLLEDKRKKTDPLNYSLKTLKIYLALTEGSIFHGSSWRWTKSGTMQSGHCSTLPMSSLKTERGFSLSDILEDCLLYTSDVYKRQVQSSKYVHIFSKIYNSHTNKINQSNAFCCR